jgi:hypothetical protein
LGTLEELKMKRIFVLLCCLFLSWNVNALEVSGVQLADSAHLGTSDLVLNGAGLRTKLFFKVYVAALYLTQKQTVANAIIADENPQRVALHMLRNLSDEQLLNAFNEAIAENHTKAEMAELEAPLKQMTDIFQLRKEIKVGDVITLDYLPGSGTQISLNGTVQGTIAGEKFHRALLKIWLGENPAQDSLKLKLLGEK